MLRVLDQPVYKGRSYEVYRMRQPITLHHDAACGKVHLPYLGSKYASNLDTGSVIFSLFDLQALP